MQIQTHETTASKSTMQQLELERRKKLISSHGEGTRLYKENQSGLEYKKHKKPTQ